MSHLISRRVLLVSSIIAAIGTIPSEMSRGQYFPQSVPDKKTVYNPVKAAKARTLADYVITQNQDHRIKYSTTHGERTDFRGARAEMVIDDFRYTVYVALYDKERATQIDSLSIFIRPKDERIMPPPKAHFKDIGLDGRCNEGWLSKDLRQLNKTGKDVEFGLFTGIGSPKRIWVQDRTTTQNAYEATLDKLITFYELPKSGYM